jgi:hypothetical protein
VQIRPPAPGVSAAVAGEPVHGLSWGWILLELTAAPALALLAAYPLWRSRQMILGNISGTAVIFAFAIGLILREYVELDGLAQACLDQGMVCWPEPSAFTRFAVYASIGMIEVFALFTAALMFEERARRRNYAREWQ